jgi:hypothetical protein
MAGCDWSGGPARHGVLERPPFRRSGPCTSEDWTWSATVRPLLPRAGPQSPMFSVGALIMCHRRPGEHFIGSLGPTCEAVPRVVSKALSVALDAMVELPRVGDLTLPPGESPRWDDRPESASNANCPCLPTWRRVTSRHPPKSSVSLFDDPSRPETRYWQHVVAIVHSARPASCLTLARNAGLRGGSA